MLRYVIFTYALLIGLEKIGLKWMRNINMLKAKNITSSFIIIVCISISLASFCALKLFIPIITPYSWDPLLIRTDFFLMFKHHPWLVLKNKFALSDIPKKVAIFGYVSWFIVNYLVMWWQIVSSNIFARNQFLISWVATWLFMGIVVATIFSSVGPCFYNSFYHDTPEFINIMHESLYNSNKINYFYLIKSSLLNNYQNKQFIPGTGISAFPSLHVAIATINCIAISKKLPKLYLVSVIYILLVTFSCVYSGLHYLIDCIAGALGAVIIWYVVGKVLRSLRNNGCWRS